MKDINDVILPDDIYYAASHEWAKAEGDKVKVKYRKELLLALLRAPFVANTRQRYWNGTNVCMIYHKYVASTIRNCEFVVDSSRRCVFNVSLMFQRRQSESYSSMPSIPTLPPSAGTVAVWGCKPNCPILPSSPNFKSGATALLPNHMLKKACWKSLLCITPLGTP